MNATIRRRVITSNSGFNLNLNDRAAFGKLLSLRRREWIYGMTSPVTYPIDDKDLDDAALWAVIDSAVASFKSRKPLAIKNTNHHSPNHPIPISISNPSPQTHIQKIPRNHTSPAINFGVSSGSEVVQNSWEHQRPQKVARYCGSELSGTSPLAVAKQVHHTLTTPSFSPPEIGRFSVREYTPTAPQCSPTSYAESEVKEGMRHSLSGRFPTVSLFKEYQNAAMAILEKGDYTMISGSPFIKKSGWRKISFYFNLSFEIKDKTIEFDENRNVLRAEFVARAHMQGGRFSDGWGSCDRREKRFTKPNHDIPSTAETRAKNKACQDLLGIGEYRPG